MTDAEHSAGPIKVVREAGFRRIGIDTVFFATVGADLEAALMIRSSDISAIGRDDNTSVADINSADVLVDLARVRMSAETALSAFQNLYLVLRSSDFIAEDAMREMVADLDGMLATREGQAE